MKKSNVIFFMCFLLLVSFSKAEPYQYMQMVLQYPHGLCYNIPTCISPLPKKFTIHGLWPSNYTYNQELTCDDAFTKNPFDSKQLTPTLKNNLAKSWPTVYKTNTNLKFWEHEYNQHGACAVESGQPPFTQTLYFETAHQLWKTYDVYDILEKAGIVPSATTKYNYKQMETAIQTITQHVPVIRCRVIVTGTTKEYYLAEIIICFDHQAGR